MGFNQGFKHGFAHPGKVLYHQATLKELMKASPKRWIRLTHSKQRIGLSKNREITCLGNRSMTQAYLNHTQAGLSQRNKEGFFCCRNDMTQSNSGKSVCSCQHRVADHQEFGAETRETLPTELLPGSPSAALLTESITCSGVTLPTLGRALLHLSAIRKMATGQSDVGN